MSKYENLNRKQIETEKHDPYLLKAKMTIELYQKEIGKIVEVYKNHGVEMFGSGDKTKIEAIKKNCESLIKSFVDEVANNKDHRIIANINNAISEIKGFLEEIRPIAEKVEQEIKKRNLKDEISEKMSIKKNKSSGEKK